MNKKNGIGNVLNLWLSNFRLFIFLVIFLVMSISAGTAIKIKVDSTATKVDFNSTDVVELKMNNREQKVLLQEIKEDQKSIEAKLDRLIERLIP